MRMPKPNHPDSVKFRFKGRYWYGWMRLKRKKGKGWVKTWTVRPCDWSNGPLLTQEWLGALRSYSRYRELHGL